MSTLLELLGFALVVAGLALVSVPLALIAGGALLVVIAQAVERRARVAPVVVAEP